MKLACSNEGFVIFLRLSDSFIPIYKEINAVQIEATTSPTFKPRWRPILKQRFNAFLCNVPTFFECAAAHRANYRETSVLNFTDFPPAPSHPSYFPQECNKGGSVPDLCCTMNYCVSLIPLYCFERGKNGGRRRGPLGSFRFIAARLLDRQLIRPNEVWSWSSGLRVGEQPLILSKGIGGVRLLIFWD